MGSCCPVTLNIKSLSIRPKWATRKLKNAKKNQRKKEEISSYWCDDEYLTYQETLADYNQAIKLIKGSKTSQTTSLAQQKDTTDTTNASCQAGS